MTKSDQNILVSDVEDLDDLVAWHSTQQSPTLHSHAALCWSPFPAFFFAVESIWADHTGRRPVRSATMLSFMQLTVVWGLTCLTVDPCWSCCWSAKFRYKLHQKNPIRKMWKRLEKAASWVSSWSYDSPRKNLRACCVHNPLPTTILLCILIPSCGHHLEQASSALIGDNPIILYAMSISCHFYRLLSVHRWYHFWDPNICQPRNKVCPENCVAPVAVENTPGHARPRPLSPLWHGPLVPVVMVHLASIRWCNSHSMIRVI